MTRLAYLALGFFAGVVITLSLRRERTCPTCDAVERGLDEARAGRTHPWPPTKRVTLRDFGPLDSHPTAPGWDDDWATDARTAGLVQ